MPRVAPAVLFLLVALVGKTLVKESEGLAKPLLQPPSGPPQDFATGRALAMEQMREVAARRPPRTQRPLRSPRSPPLSRYPSGCRAACRPRLARIPPHDPLLHLTPLPHPQAAGLNAVEREWQRAVPASELYDFKQPSRNMVMTVIPKPVIPRSKISVGFGMMAPRE